jgi:CRP-like cAMP-binding protein
MLLAALPDADWRRIAPRLQLVELKHRQPLEAANLPTEHVFFPTRGIVSIVAKSPDGHQIEAGVIGREGMTGLAIVMSNHRSPNDAFVQVAGEAQCMSASAAAPRSEFRSYLHDSGRPDSSGEWPRQDRRASRAVAAHGAGPA